MVPRNDSIKSRAQVTEENPGVFLFLFFWSVSRWCNANLERRSTNPKTIHDDIYERHQPLIDSGSIWYSIEYQILNALRTWSSHMWVKMHKVLITGIFIQNTSNLITPWGQIKILTDLNWIELLVRQIIIHYKRLELCCDAALPSSALVVLTI